MKLTRKTFVKSAAILAGATLLNTKKTEAQITNALVSLDNDFALPPLGYNYDALEPFIDKQTMEIHYSKHHQAYVNKLNEAKAKITGWNYKTLNDVLVNINNIPKDLQAAVRNNAGGHYNHSLFWSLLKTNTKPSENVLKAINENFESLDNFKQLFAKAAMGTFGSGWAWLIKQDGKLKIVATPNQDNPLMTGITKDLGTPIIALDVWEHAYYLKYQNKRADYVTAFWSVLNWEKVEELLVNSR
ncbi:MAG: superoxide dismutase [Bacteroidia bacterium]